jgi:hypothetical protein
MNLSDIRVATIASFVEIDRSPDSLPQGNQQSQIKTLR